MFFQMLFKPALILTTFCLPLVCAPALAQDRPVDPLWAMLELVPQDTIDSHNGLIEIEFGDAEVIAPLAALSQVQGLISLDASALAAGRSLPADIMQDVALADPDELFASVGLRHQDFRQTLAIRSLPSQIMMMRLSGEALDNVYGVLHGRGYEPDLLSGLPVLWSGEQDNGIDFDALDPTNPFGGRLGRSARLGFGADVLLYSPAWPEITRALSAGPVLAESVVVEAIMSALNDVIEAPASMSRAYLILTPDASDRPTDLATELGLSVPGQLLAIAVTDIANGTTESGALTLVLAPGSDAEAVATRMRENWDDVADPITGQPYSAGWDIAPQITAHTGEVPAVSLLMAGSWGEDGAMDNQAYLRLLRLVHFQALGPLVD